MGLNENTYDTSKLRPISAIFRWTLSCRVVTSTRINLMRSAMLSLSNGGTDTTLHLNFHSVEDRSLTNPAASPRRKNVVSLCLVVSSILCATLGLFLEAKYMGVIIEEEKAGAAIDSGQLPSNTSPILGSERLTLSQFPQPQ